MKLFDRPHWGANRLAAGLAAAMTIVTAATASAPAQAREIGPVFQTALKACLANVQGQLPLNPPSQAQTDAGLVLADPAGPAELKAFDDLSPSDRMFASVAAGDGKVVIAEVAPAHLCRIVVYAGVDPTAIGAQVGYLSNDWTLVSDDPTANYAVYRGTILGSPPLNISIRKPAAGSGYGDAIYVMTLTR